MSSKTRWSGCANEVAVYSIRGVCTARPQPQFSATRRSDRPPTNRRTAGMSSTRRISETPRIRGESDPGRPAARSTEPDETTADSADNPPRAPRLLVSVLTTRAGANPNATQTATSANIPPRLVRRTSTAPAAWAVRGWARNPVPNALTKVAAANPPVSATAPTARGIVIAIATFDPDRPWTSDLSRSHSLTNPLNGGSAAMARLPT